MFRLATSPLAPVLGQHVPMRGPARLLHRSYARAAALPAARPAAPADERVLTMSTGDRFRINLASLLEWHLWAFGSFENYHAQLFPYLVSPGDRCLDVGANIGVHAVRLGRLAGPAGEVIAVEPDPELARRAADNAALNGLRNVRLVQAAASDQAALQVSLYRATTRDPNRGRASLLPHAYLTGRAEQVGTVTVDQLTGADGRGAAGTTGPVSLIKIDVEGHEAAVVAGAARTIARYHPAVIFEYAPELLPDPAQCPFGVLAGAGYAMFRIRVDRHRLTGRGRLSLQPLPAQPEIGGDLLAVRAADVARVSSLVRPA
jgi:FkbM family methyltransferase